jgi:hypothetical protein
MEGGLATANPPSITFQVGTSLIRPSTEIVGDPDRHWVEFREGLTFHHGIDP